MLTRFQGKCAVSGCLNDILYDAPIASLWIYNSPYKTLTWSTSYFTMANSTRTCSIILTHCGLMTPYGDRDLGQHWLRQWPVAWRHHAITWTNVDLSSIRSIGIHSSTILQQILQPPITTISWKITLVKFLWNLPRASEINDDIILKFHAFLFTPVPIWRPHENFMSKHVD